MTSDSMTWGERIPLAGNVDFTLMYIAHDAFARDLARLRATLAREHLATPAAQASWRMFERQLHVHHTTEDTALWPRLRAVDLSAAETAVLDDMEREHAAIDPWLEAVADGFAQQDAAALAESVQALAVGLLAHMRHEEQAALPLVDVHLGQRGWDAFGAQVRKTQGLRGGAAYLPWVLDEAPAAARTTVLNMLPPPVRLVYRRVWEPRYARGVHLGGVAA